jgi:DNA replication protein DnaC
MNPKADSLHQRTTALHLHGVLEHWSELADAPWLEPLITWEEQARAHRSLERRLADAHIGRFKSLADFDWFWPRLCDRAAVEGLMTLEFIKQSSNVVLRGNNGVGKSMLAKNVAHQALVQGYTVRFTTAGEMLGELAALDSDAALRRRLRHWAHVDLLVIDEIGYLSYSNRHADLLFELVNRRYEAKSTIITTNKAFADWAQVFPNAACVVSLVDRLLHHSEIIAIEGESYRLKEAQERSAQLVAKRKKATS